MRTRHINFLDRETERVKPRNTAKIVAIFLFVLVVASGILISAKASQKIDNNPLAYDPVTLEPKKPEGFLKKISYFVFNKNAPPLEGQKDDRINMLLLGMGGLGHDGPFLTDTIIVASVKPSENKVALVSIPRDLGVKIPEYGTYKINHANAFGENEKKDWGAALATEVVENTFDIEIPYYVRIDFKAFEEIVDELGGVKVNIERSFTDPMYPAPNDAYQNVSFAAGIQNMSGKTALKYARSRHGNNGEGSDFSRAKRQQKILLAVKEKLLSFGTLANPVRINKVMKALDRHMTTNMEFSEIVSFIKMAKEMEVKEIKTLVLDNSVNGYLKNSFTESGSYILEPKTGNFKEISKTIKNIFEIQETMVDDTPAQEEPLLNPANIEIQNGTWHAGMAARLKKRLQNKNFTIETIGNAAQKPISASAIYKISNADVQDVTNALQSELHIPIKKTVPSGIETATSTDIIVVLGDDFPE